MKSSIEDLNWKIKSTSKGIKRKTNSNQKNKN
jgi:hypothetical protein